MALINCIECGKEISDMAESCVHCGCPVPAPNPYPNDKIREINGVMVNIDELISEHGTDKISTIKHLREITGISLSEGKRIVDIAHRNRGIKQPGFFQQVKEQASQIQMAELTGAAQSDKHQTKLDKLEMKTAKIEAKTKEQELRDLKNTARCPRCKSTSLTANQKGFGAGKAAVGSLVNIPVALLAGSIGSKKVQVTCLKCKKKFYI